MNNHITMYAILVFITLLCSMEAVNPIYNPALEMRETSRNDLIVKYFNLGLKASEILTFLANIHGFKLSLRHVS